MGSAARLARGAGLALLLGLGLVPAGQACRTPPVQQTVGPDALIAGAQDVSVAKVVYVAELGDGLVRYDFEVQRRLLGPGRKEFSLSGRAVGRYQEREGSPDHSDETFWQHGGGRLTNEGDCVLRPAFRLGESYLMFMNQTATWRSFERIGAADDKWFAYVEEKLRTRPQQ
ncbi:hypothetical protein [Massilia sp. BSC265]|uniref:hypothetical protein n=1 Tax=Massilia sp. BSC265 TaxID=1549812 RepID=UPI0004E8E07B|nr:hypothetical protein [Massilia sp. BSC265]KFI08358.1 hypothetical protein JN27_04115 [Massilia sp. BSC265]